MVMVLTKICIPPRRRRTERSVRWASTNKNGDRLTEMKGGLLLNAVVGEGMAIFVLLPGKDQAPLVRGNALLVLNLSLDVVDGIGGLDLKGNGSTRSGLDEDPHSTAETKDQVEG